MSDEQGGGSEGSAPRLRVAEVFDGRVANGGILISRPQVDPAELAGLTAYLTTAPVALATTKTGEDEMSPGAGLVVPRAYHTDGAWIWPAAVGYYLHRYRLPPQPELIEHIRARGFQVGAVPEELRQAAAAQMLADLAAAKRVVAGSGAAGSAGASGAARPSGASGGTGASAGAGRVAGSAGSAGASGATGSTAGAGGAAGLAGMSGAAGSTARVGGAAGSAASASGVSASGVAGSAGASGAVAAADLGSSGSGVRSSTGNGDRSGLSGAGSAPAPVGPVTAEPVEVKPAESSLWLPAPMEAAYAEEPRFEAEPELERELERESESVREGVRASAAVPTPDAVSAADGQSPRSAAVTDTSLDALPAALPVLAFSTAFIAAGNRHAAWVYEQIETFLDFMPLDEWSVDHDTRRYRQAGREFTVDALGRLAHDGRWIWAWAEPESWSEGRALTERSRGLREQGHRLGIEELTAPVLDLSETEDADDPETAAEMLAWTAMGVSGARGYIGHAYTDEGRIYYLSFDESIPNPVPDLDGILHFLSHGVAKFEEDSTDCVLGYVERHGWDWSRSSDGGIVIGAGELGSFTAVLSRDGVLTGIAVPQDQESIEPTV